MERIIPQALVRRVVRLAIVAFALSTAACRSATFEPEPLLQPTGPIDVRAAAELAASNHPDARSAREHLRRADALTADARAARWPDFAAGAEFTRTDRPSQAFGTVLDQGEFDAGIDFDDPGARSNLRPSIGGSFVLYDGGRRRAGLAAAEAESAASAADARAIASVVALAATRAWFDVHASERALDLAVARVQLARREVQLARDEAELGARLTRDVDERELALEHEREALAAARDGVTRARAALAVLLGFGVEQKLALTPYDASAAAHESGRELGALLAEARASRPELVAAQARIEAALARVRVAEAGWAPNLALDANFGFDGAGSDLDRSNWLFGADLVANVTAMLRTPQRVRAALSDLAVAHEDARRELLAVESEVHAAQLDHERARRVAAVAERGFVRANDELARTRSEFDAGAARALAVERAEVAALATQTNRTLAHLELAAARIALDHALGRFPATLEPQR